MGMTRREFIKRGSSGITLAAASLSFPEVFARTAAAATRFSPNGKILVMLQLTGGNDGLNTVVPYRDDMYRQLRPTVGIQRDQVLSLDDEVGLCPQLRPMKEMFDEGLLTLVQGVGYPNPNRSHFESMDIWHCADPSLQKRETGWLGRVLERDPGLQALHIDDQPLPLALRAERAEVPSVRSIESFKLQGGKDSAASRAIDAMLAERESGAASRDELQFIRRAAVSACRNAERLEALPGDMSQGYPAFGLAGRLREIARLIAADFGPRIYYTSLGGFDTHARQNTVHPDLMAEMGQSVKAFFDDLRHNGLADRVLLVTFSEFGRRAGENASMGTDHGAAAPLFLAGPAVKAGVIGPRPDLSKLVDGDVPHSIDFRCVYETVLESWLEVPAGDILAGSFGHLALLK